MVSKLIFYYFCFLLEDDLCYNLTMVNKIFTNIKIFKNKTPFVVVPLKLWQEIEEKIEELEMLQAKYLRKKIEKARKEKKLYSPDEVRKILKIK